MNDKTNVSSKAVALKATDLAQYRQDLWVSRYDVPRTLTPASRSHGNRRVRSYDRVADLLLVGTSGSQQLREKEGTVIVKNGVPHKIRFHWRGACAYAVFIGIIVGFIR